MQRILQQYLTDWLSQQNRKPLIIRGARQVGKTWLAYHLAQIHNLQLIEFNFEKQPDAASLFASNDVNQILINLQSSTEKTIIPECSLLFLDEIQACPEILAKLRWFAEDLPALPVIAAGSLLEFTLVDHAFSMPVGRISYVHLEPLSFQEYLLAKGRHQLFEYLQNFQLTMAIPLAIHQQLMSLFKEYLIIGGMPAAVSSWIQNESLAQVEQIHHDLLATYRDDFAKYAGKISHEALESIMLKTPQLLAKKFVYSHINQNIPSVVLKKALDLLIKAKICYPVKCVGGNGTPLATEVKEKFFKITLLDVGLVCALLKLKINQFSTIDDLTLISQGGITEQVVGQLLRTIESPYIAPELYYWTRTAKGAESEVDYLTSQQNQVIPIEVKSGSTGSLKSLHYFMSKKQYKLAVRINGDQVSVTDIDVLTQVGETAKYRLLSIPFYLTEQLYRLLSQVEQTPGV